MERLIRQCSFARGRALAAGLGVCRQREGNHVLAELKVGDSLLPHLLLKANAWLHAHQKLTHASFFFSFFFSFS